MLDKSQTQTHSANNNDGVRQPPWLLQHHLDGNIDLDKELSARFRTMPVLSIAKMRQYDAQHAMAMLSAQDGAATVRVDVDLANNLTQFAFTFRSMLTLNFTLDQLGISHRAHWLALTRRDPGKPAFLWGEARWQNDYIITVVHAYYTNLYAFSLNNFEAAARLTPDVTTGLVDWLEGLWRPGSAGDETIPALTTW